MPRLSSETPPNTATASPTQRGVPVVCAMAESLKSLIYFVSPFGFRPVPPGNVHPRHQRPKAPEICTKVCRILRLHRPGAVRKAGYISTSTSKDYAVYLANVNFAIGERL